MKEALTGLFTNNASVATTILLLAFVIGTGLWLARFKVKGITIGSTWIIFVGIILSHFGMTGNPTLLHFVKEFGLILFVFSIGLQVGPGFFHSFRKGGVKMNLLAAMNILLAVAVTVVIASISSKDDPATMVGVMSGAVTNTPGLGAAQQAIIDTPGADAAVTSTLATGYAVAYPLGVLGVLFTVILLKALFKVNIPDEEKAVKAAEDTGEQARRMHVRIENPAIFGRRLSDVIKEFHEQFQVSRIMKGEDIQLPGPDTVLDEGDKLLIVCRQEDVDHIRIIFGEEIEMHVTDWRRMDKHYVARRIVVTKASLTGKKLRELHFRGAFGVNVTRIIRSGVELVAGPESFIQMGDILLCVGNEDAINKVAEKVGNHAEMLNRPNLVPIFLGIVVGVIFGSIPITFPGLPQPVKLGLAGGPLIIAILLGHFGPKYHITTYTTASANLMIREIGISLFLAAVGLGAGEGFVEAIVGGGYRWILYGVLITVIPVLITGIVGRLVCRLNFFQICGLISGSNTNPAVLAFAQNAYGSEYTSVNYATVYPLSMFLRVLAAQILVLVAVA